MSEAKRKLRNSKQTELPEGPDSKKRKAPAPHKSPASKKKDSTTLGEGLVQAKVEDVVANKASESGANLVDPNTGQEVQVPSGDSSKPKSSKPKSSKAASKAKERNPGQLVDPNTGNKVEASATVESKPATKPSSSSKSKKEQSGEDRAGPSTSSGKVEPSSEKDQPVSINRAPVLTLWVAVVAERQGFSKEAGMTFGKAISGMLAQSKGRSIGVFDNKDTVSEKQEKEEEEHKQGIAKHDVFGMSIKAKDVDEDGDVRATDTNMQYGCTFSCNFSNNFCAHAMNHKQVEGYLQRAFKDRLQDAKAALEALANSYKAEDIGQHCYHLYEQFRPTVTSGQKGWGQKGQLDLMQIRQLAEDH